ncbi:hypothetical protein MYFR107205_29985 [Mycolicibacterium frederiksbergense]
MFLKSSDWLHKRSLRCLRRAIRRSQTSGATSRDESAILAADTHKQCLGVVHKGAYAEGQRSSAALIIGRSFGRIGTFATMVFYVAGASPLFGRCLKVKYMTISCSRERKEGILLL